MGQLVNYAKSGVLVTGLGGVIIWMSFEFSYSRLDRNVWERVPRSTENQRVFVHESCSNFFLSSSAFALKESSSAGVKNRISGRITSSASRHRDPALDVDGNTELGNASEQEDEEPSADQNISSGVTGHNEQETFFLSARMA